jgi:hypothetical protein
MVCTSLPGGTPSKLVHYQLSRRFSQQAGTVPACQEAPPKSWCLYQLTRRARNTLPRLAVALPASVFVRWVFGRYPPVFSPQIKTHATVGRYLLEANRYLQTGARYQQKGT